MTLSSHTLPLKVLRYRKDQKYDAHWDYFFDQVNSVNGGNRYATVGAVCVAVDTLCELGDVWLSVGR